MEPDISMKPDITDSLVAIAIILFILSTIVEKITQLIRSYSPFIGKKSRKGTKNNALTGLWRHINRKQNGVDRELDRKTQREVNSLSMVIGLLIAIMFKVDLLKMMFVNDPRKALLWSSETNYGIFDWVLLPFSIFLTAFFLSFGSKFFHDLLDTLLQVKNLKRKLVDEETYKVGRVEELDEYLDRSYEEIVQTAIDQNRSALVAPNAMAPPMHGRIIRAGKLTDCVEIHLNDDQRNAIPQTITAKLEKGKIVKVPVNVVYDVERPTALVAQGDTVASTGFPGFKGTICCKISRNNQTSLLTCSHVLTGGSGNNLFGKIPPVPANIGAAPDPDGNFIYAVCDDKYDLALVDPDDHEFSYQIEPKKERMVTPSDNITTNVRVVCRDNTVKEGTIVVYKARDPIDIEYKPHDVFGLRDLIILSRVTVVNGVNQYSRITVPGDSGACVFDDNDHPIGMIVAGNNKFSYAIPMTSILNRLGATIKKS